MIVFVKLLLAHLLGDFLLQPSAWVTDKEHRKFKSPYLYLHTAIHGVLAGILVVEKNFIVYAVLLAVVHGLIDLVKLSLQNAKTKRGWFIADQLMHLAVLIIITLLYEKVNPLQYSFDQRNWLLIAGIILLTSPASIIIRNVISIWTPATTQSTEDLQSAGKYIGILERLFIFCFILTGHFEAIGFLLAAKSIFRFGDLTQSKDRRLTEYVLIGTLLSFGIAVVTGLGVQAALLAFF